jgi:hypothetical protein
MRQFWRHRLRWWIWLLKQERRLKQESMLEHAEGRWSS